MADNIILIPEAELAAKNKAARRRVPAQPKNLSGIPCRQQKIASEFVTSFMRKISNFTKDKQLALPMSA